MLKLDVQPGLVSAAVFVCFELIALGLLDASLSKIAVSQCYRRICRGEPIRVVSADVMGITSNLVGSRWDAVNVAIFVIKLIFIIIVFHINSEIVSIPVMSSTSYSFSFKSMAAWIGNDPTVTRKWSEVRRCHMKRGDEITYYRIGFNLIKGKTAPEHPEIFGKFAATFNAEDASVQCLSPDRVHGRQHLVKIVGCSRLNVSSCNQRESLVRTYNSSKHGRLTFRNFGAVIPKFTILDKHDKIKFNRFRAPLPSSLFPKRDAVDIGAINIIISEYVSFNLNLIWPKYNDVKLTCLDTHLGRFERMDTRYKPCLLTSASHNRTLLEHWTLNDTEGLLSFSRHYPGPIFDGNATLSRVQTMHVLLRLVENVDWEVLSALIITNSLKFERKDFSFSSIEGDRVTVIPSYSLYCALGAFLVAVITSIAVRFTIGKDHRPKFNTIDGLSSILREELEAKEKNLEFRRKFTMERDRSHQRITGLRRANHTERPLSVSLNQSTVTLKSSRLDSWSTDSSNS